MPVIVDEEFGEIKIIRSNKASSIRIKVAQDGTLRASLPPYAPSILVKRLIRSSRNEIREMLKSHTNATIYVDDMKIGKSHHLITRMASSNTSSVTKHGQQIIVSLPEGVDITDDTVQALIRPVVIDALRKEAKSYLPRRLAFLSKQHGFTYSKVRFSHASSRWGSCSSNGTISLNIALMKLPFHLIDYVLIHELAHTEQMNHSKLFWETVGRCEPRYKSYRGEIKEYSPSI